jgi:hypothetical protein
MEIPIKIRDKYTNTIPRKKTKARPSGAGSRKVKCLIPNLNPNQLKESKIPRRMK